MNVRIIAFTDRGFALAERLAEGLDGTAVRCNRPLSLGDWTAQAFKTADGLVFVGAAGIAVRAIAPHVQSKTTDPAVVVVDEAGKAAISLLSGHLGGANDLARRIGELCGAAPIITTATDQNGIFAVDAWARQQDCAVGNPGRIKAVSAKLLAGGTICVQSDYPIAGEPPAGVLLTEGSDADVWVSLHSTDRDVLRIVPRIAVLGVGCKQGTSRETIEAVVSKLCRQNDLDLLAVSEVCTIDRKGSEPGLLEFCRSHDLPYRTFTAEELRAVPGEFHGSPFVEGITGVDNVCERSAVLGSGGTLWLEKYAENGVTVAAAFKPFEPDWRWQYG